MGKFFVQYIRGEAGLDEAVFDTEEIAVKSVSLSLMHGFNLPTPPKVQLEATTERVFSTAVIWEGDLVAYITHDLDSMRVYNVPMNLNDLPEDDND